MYCCFRQLMSIRRANNNPPGSRANYLSARWAGELSRLPALCINRNCCYLLPDLEFSRLQSWSRDVSRPVFTSLGLGLGLEPRSLDLGLGLGTSESWSWSWSWNLRVLVLVLDKQVLVLVLDKQVLNPSLLVTAFWLFNLFNFFNLFAV